jgi:hypothetical protein
MTRIFLNYRREDSRGSAGRIFDRLNSGLGKGTVFRDLEMLPGEDFVEKIESGVSSAKVLLVIIGKQWLTLVDQSGQRRIDEASDFVRLEIEMSMKRGILVIPVLVDGARMPSAEELPGSLKPLARRQAIEVSDQRFDYDMERLTAQLRPIASQIGTVSSRSKSMWVGGGAIVLAIAVLVAVVSQVHKTSPPEPKSSPATNTGVEARNAMPDAAASGKSQTQTSSKASAPAPRNGPSPGSTEAKPRKSAPDPPMVVAPVGPTPSASSTPARPIIEEFSVSPSRVKKGDEAIIEWKTRNAASVELTPIVSGIVASSGSRPVRPQQTLTYILIAKSESGETVSREATVTVDVTSVDNAPGVKNPQTSETHDASNRGPARVTARSPRYRLKLERLFCVQDGGEGADEWRFEVRVGESLLQLSRMPYNDKSEACKLGTLPTAFGNAVVVLTDNVFPATVTIRGFHNGKIRGERLEATATAPMTSSGFTGPVELVAAAGEKKGHFRFVFSLTAE